MQKLKIHPNGRHLMYEDGTPFFYLGDTAWDMFQHLSREEVEYYIHIRAKQGYNALQCILLNGTEPFEEQYPSAYGRFAIKRPFDKLDFDVEGPNSYWEYVDWCVDCAARYGVYMALLPMWNSKYNDPEDTLFTGYEPSYTYGKFLGERYRDKENIIWMFGGDVDVHDHMEPIFRGLADGIREAEGPDNHLITFHPGGLSSSVGQLKGDRDYIDFHSSQSGHTVLAYKPYEFFSEMAPTGKPFLDTEPHYEDHVANWVPEFRRFDGADIRHGAYECILAGACGHTYGNPLIAFFTYEPFEQFKYDYYLGDLKDTGWMDALTHEGGVTLGFMKKLFLSRPFFQLRPAQELVLNSDDDLLFGRISAARGDNYAIFYSPQGREIRVDCTQFDQPFMRATWYNPRTGEEKEICYFPPTKAVFVPETQGKGQDWVLIVDNFDRKWEEVGQIEAE